MLPAVVSREKSDTRLTDESRKPPTEELTERASVLSEMQPSDGLLTEPRSSSGARWTLQESGVRRKAPAESGVSDFHSTLQLSVTEQDTMSRGNWGGRKYGFGHHDMAKLQDGIDFLPVDLQAALGVNEVTVFFRVFLGVWFQTEH